MDGRLEKVLPPEPRPPPCEPLPSASLRTAWLLSFSFSLPRLTRGALARGCAVDDLIFYVAGSDTDHSLEEIAQEETNEEMYSKALGGSEDLVFVKRRSKVSDPDNVQRLFPGTGVRWRDTFCLNVLLQLRYTVTVAVGMMSDDRFSAAEKVVGKYTSDPHHNLISMDLFSRDAFCCSRGVPVDLPAGICRRQRPDVIHIPAGNYTRKPQRD